MNFVKSICLFIVFLAMNNEECWAANALHSVNAKRAAIGLYALRYDPQLQVIAQQRADAQARRFRMGHVARNSRGRSTSAPADMEGAGMWSVQDHEGRHFHACNMATGMMVRGRYPWGKYSSAGAATSVARGPKGRIHTFYCILLRN